MAESPYRRIVGVETEFGCLVLDDDLGRPEDVVEAIKEHVFEPMRLGLIDLHARDDVFEPARSGGFLLNGGRLYVDAVGSHLEYATAECMSLRDLVANDRAGQRIIVRALRELGFNQKVKVFNNSVDHFGGHTFGCHENYLVRMEDDFFATKVPFLLPFLATRQIYAGVGRVGGHVLTESNKRVTYDELMENPVDYIWVSHVYGVEPDPSVRFQISQRADHILRSTASRVRFNRAMINPKWENFYAHDQLQRLHLLFGEANQSEYAYMLKVGTTRLVLRLIEESEALEGVLLASPLRALREISRDPDWKWRIPDVLGEPTSAVEIQRRYHEYCSRYAGEDADVDWTLEHWAKTLDALERNPLELADRLDWVAKYQLIHQMVSEEGLDWGEEVLHTWDMEYHNIDPEESLHHALVEMGAMRSELDSLDAVDAMTDPPTDTRAFPRSKLIESILAKGGLGAYAIDWSGVAVGRRDYRDLSDPFSVEIPPKFG